MLTNLLSTIAIKKKEQPAPTEVDETAIMGKDYFRNPEVNEGFYSLKRAGVADVDPKVSNRSSNKNLVKLTDCLVYLGYGAIPPHPRKASTKGRH